MRTPRPWAAALRTQQRLLSPLRLCPLSVSSLSSRSLLCSRSTLPSSPRLSYSTQTPTPPTSSAPPDHRDLGVKQELFTTSVYSPGSPLFLPNGARIFNRLVDFLRKQYVRYGFQEVITPTIYKKALWAKSGHLENYADDMFTVTSGKARQETGHGDGQPNDALEHEFGLKPMNCPGHCLLFASQRHSYRDLPIRYADFSPLHRDEVSGALSGLTRVRRFHQDDGHIFCRPSQVEAEIRSTLDFVRHVYGILGLGPYRLVLSTRPTDGHLIGTDADWDAAEDALRRALDHDEQSQSQSQSKTGNQSENKTGHWTVNPGDGAFYGPKIDIILRDSDGKEHQTATVQLDFQLPRRFELEYQGEQGSSGGEEAKRAEDAGGGQAGEEVLDADHGRPVLIHRAVLGSVERLMALLIEHYNGRWPFWLNPRQVALLTVNDSAPVLDYVRHVQSVLTGTTSPLSSPTPLASVDVDSSARTLPLKVREAKSKGYGAIVVIGPKDVQQGTVAVDLGGIPQRATSRDSRSGTDKDAQKPSRNVHMTPNDLLQHLLEKVQAYQ